MWLLTLTKGAAAKSVMARPLSLAAKVSAMTPPEFVRGEDPKAPAKKRKMMSVQIFCAPAAPALNAVKAPNVAK